MIEILNCIQVNNHPYLKAKFSIKLPIGNNKMIIKDMSCFKKDNSRWITFPTRPYEKDGQKKYYNFIMLDDPQQQNELNAEILNALDKFLQNDKNINSSNSQNDHTPNHLPF